MYQIAAIKNSTIAHNRNGNRWDILFRRTVKDWEMGQLMELLADLERYNIDVTMEDTMCWGRKDTFKVKECYRMIGTQNQVVDDWPWKLIRKKMLPPKVICFNWIALHEVSLTPDNLKRKGLQLVNRCYIWTSRKL